MQNLCIPYKSCSYQSCIKKIKALLIRNIWSKYNTHVQPFKTKDRQLHPVQTEATENSPLWVWYFGIFVTFFTKFPLLDLHFHYLSTKSIQIQYTYLTTLHNYHMWLILSNTGSKSAFPPIQGCCFL